MHWFQFLTSDSSLKASEWKTARNINLGDYYADTMTFRELILKIFWQKNHYWSFSSEHNRRFWGMSASRCRQFLIWLQLYNVKLLMKKVEYICKSKLFKDAPLERFHIWQEADMFLIVEWHSKPVILTTQFWSSR